MEIDLVKNIEKAFKGEIPIKITLNSGNDFWAFLHYIIYLEGDLTIIGEDIVDGSLFNFAIGNITKIDPNIDMVYTPKCSLKVIEKYIEEIRRINGSDERLILKIKQIGNLSIPPYQYLIRPFMTTNQFGDMIWAATVEVSEVLFIWLLSLNGKVEIIGTDGIKIRYLKFCESRLKNQEDSNTKLVS